MIDDPDKNWWERRFREGPVDWGFLVFGAVAFIAAFTTQRLLFPNAPGYLYGAIALGLLFAYSVYRLLTFRD